MHKLPLHRLRYRFSYNLGYARFCLLYSRWASPSMPKQRLQRIPIWGGQVAAPAGPALHAQLLDRYLADSGGADLSDVADDGYFLQAVGYHAMAAGRLFALERLLCNPIWLEHKLHSYGVASIVADFRR